MRLPSSAASPSVQQSAAAVCTALGTPPAAERTCCTGRHGESLFTRSLPVWRGNDYDAGEGRTLSDLGPGRIFEPLAPARCARLARAWVLLSAHRRRWSNAAGGNPAAPVAMRGVAGGRGAPSCPVFTEQFHRVLRTLRPVAAQHRCCRAVPVATPAVTFGMRGMEWELPGNFHAVCEPPMSHHQCGGTVRGRRRLHQSAPMRFPMICSRSTRPMLWPSFFHSGCRQAVHHWPKNTFMVRPWLPAPGRNNKARRSGPCSGSLPHRPQADAARQLSTPGRLRPWPCLRTLRSGRNSCSGTRWPCRHR